MIIVSNKKPKLLKTKYIRVPINQYYLLVHKKRVIGTNVFALSMFLNFEYGKMHFFNYNLNLI